MREENFKFKDTSGLNIFVYKWLPKEDIKPVGIVQIAHGMAETAERYKRFANKLAKAGYIVFANDHRGHGKTAESVDKVGDLGEDGFNNMVQDMYEITTYIKKQYHLPIFIFGHSMGSFLTQRYIQLYGEEIDGAILSGSCGSQGLMLDLGILLAKREISKIGRSGRSERMDKLSFGSYNKVFKPNRTKSDWLTRDEKEIDKYISDQYCGGIFTAGFFYDFLNGLKLIQQKSQIVNVPKELPIYIFSGDKDPVGKTGKGVMKLVNTYKALGIKDLEYKLYKDGRHEMLNEINREEVMENVLRWLNRHV
ncbi:alpha/beta hydrolase [Haloimpatiens massiliensis]|uniref:alpha/beta hydrolase n=1 Tax=Haloimpatiens massiliensis TaxID=1658110 RepID=UPI000C839BA4|nr:alpha/beta hydrolase [Haloimpatiens massiliensis]